MKDVLLLLPGAFSGVGGIEMFNRQVVRAFSELGRERGFSVRTVVMNDWNEDVDDRYIPRGAESPRGCRRRRSVFLFETLRAVLRRAPDLVVFGHIHFARIAPLLKRLCPRSRHWYFAYGIEVWRPLPKSVRRGLALAERLLSISRFSAKEVEKNGGIPAERIDMLPCALDAVWEAQYTPRGGEREGTHGRPLLLTVARLAASERYKGVDSVIRALPGIAAEIPDVAYDVIGDGDDRCRLETLAKDLGVSNRVRFRGRLWPDELAAAYRDCTLFVMPSSKEGFGIVFLEAALFGKPSVGGLHGGTPEVVEEGTTGLLVEREDIPGLERAIRTLLANADLRLRMGSAARRRLEERFTYSSFRGAIERQLDRLAGPGESRG